MMPAAPSGGRSRDSLPRPQACPAFRSPMPPAPAAALPPSHDGSTHHGDPSRSGLAGPAPAPTVELSRAQSSIHEFRSRL